MNAFKKINFLSSSRKISSICDGKKIYVNVDKNIVRSPVKDLPMAQVPLHECIYESTRKWPTKVAVECIDTGRKYTYNDLYTKSIRIAHFLRNTAKLKDRDTVAIISPNIPEYPLIILGALQANLRVTTINPIYNADDIGKQLKMSDSKIVFTLTALHGEVSAAVSKQKSSLRHQKLILIDHNNTGEIPAGSVNFNETVNHDNTFTSPAPSLNETALLLFSSGTTGLPKGVELTHSNVVSNFCQMRCPEFVLGNEATDDYQDVLPALLPMFHVYGLNIVLLHRLTLGAKLVSIPKFSSETFLKLLIQHKPITAHLVPPIVLMMTYRPEVKPEYLESLQNITIGGAPIGQSDLDKFSEKTNNKIKTISAYGMTETSPLAITQSLVAENGYKPNAVGLLLPNTKAKIVEVGSLTEKGIGPGQIGELWLKGPQVMKGYYKNPTATKETITPDGWLKTGDVGYYDETGNFYLTERLKELIKVKGFQVAPAELEAVLRSHPLIEDAAVIGIPHPKHGEVPKAFVVKSHTATEELNPEDVQEFVAKRVANFKQLLGGVVVLDSIPKNASGKILRKDLKNL